MGGAGSAAPSCSGSQTRAAPLCNIWTPRTRAAPLRGDDASFAVIDCGTVLAGACWMRASPLLEQLGSRDERAGTAHWENPPPRRLVEDSGQGSGDAGCITVACGHQFKQRRNAVDTVDTFRRVVGITRSQVSSGASVRLWSLHSTWSHG